MKPIHWRRTKLGKYLRHLPRRKHIKGTMVHRLFGDRLFDSELWHPTRQRFASGMALGGDCGEVDGRLPEIPRIGDLRLVSHRRCDCGGGVVAVADDVQVRTSLSREPL